MFKNKTTKVEAENKNFNPFTRFLLSNSIKETVVEMENKTK